MPDRAEGSYLRVHGGGWVVGAADLEDEWLWRSATETGLVVASVEYPLAPERPYPAGLEDVEAALHWLAAKAGRSSLRVRRHSAASWPAPTGPCSRSCGCATGTGVPPRRFVAANLVFGGTT